MSSENNLEQIRRAFQEIRIENANDKTEIKRMNQELQQRAVFQDWYSFKKVFKRSFVLAYTNGVDYFRNLFVAGKKKDTSHNNKPVSNPVKHNAYKIKLPPANNKVRVKVLHAIPTFTTGGSQQLVVDLIENLSEDYEHAVIVAREIDNPGYEGGVAITQIGISETSFTEKIYSYIKSYNPEILHVHFWATPENWIEWIWYKAIFEAGFKLNIKVIENCNNPTFPFFDDRISKYIHVSNYTEKTFGLKSPNSIVIYPGSDFEKFKREEAYVPGNTIGMIYRLEKDKLNEQSIEPFIKSIKNRPGTKALIIGGGTWFDFYNKRVNEENVTDRFEFTGYVPYDELPDFYNRLSVFVAPVHSESFGQVVPFAMNMGIPVVGYNVGALSEIIGDETLLAEYGDTSALADIVVRLLNDKTRMLQISERNRKITASKFSLRSMIESYKKIYHDLIL